MNQNLKYVYKKLHEAYETQCFVIRSMILLIHLYTVFERTKTAEVRHSQ